MHSNQVKFQNLYNSSLNQNTNINTNIVFNPNEYRHCTPQNAKRFARKNNYQEVSRSPLNAKPSFKMCRTPNAQSNCYFISKDSLQKQPGLISSKNIGFQRINIQDIRLLRNAFSKPEFQTTTPEIRTLNQLHQNPSLQLSKHSVQNDSNHQYKDNKSKLSFLKTTTKSFKITRQSDEDQQVNNLFEQNKTLKKENTFLKNNIIHLQQKLTKLDKDNLILKKNNDEKIQKLNKQIKILHTSLMNQQGNSLNLQKKLKQTTSQLQIFAKEKNLIVGHIAKLSRAKLPKQCIDFQSCRQVCLQYQLNQIKKRLNQDRSQIQKQLQKQIHKQEVSYRKLQQQVNKYQIANRMLLKRAEQAQKTKESYKNCTAQYKRLKQKYSEILQQYHELKKRNIELMKQNNTSKNKLKQFQGKGNFTNNHQLTSYSLNNENNPNKLNIINNLNAPRQFIKKSNARQIQQSALFDMSMISAIKSSNVYDSKMQNTNNSEMSLSLSLDISADVQTLQLNS